MGEIKEDMNNDAIYCEEVILEKSNIKIASLHINLMQMKATERGFRLWQTC